MPTNLLAFKEFTSGTGSIRLHRLDLSGLQQALDPQLLRDIDTPDFSTDEIANLSTTSTNATLNEILNNLGATSPNNTLYWTRLIDSKNYRENFKGLIQEYKDIITADIATNLDDVKHIQVDITDALVTLSNLTRKLSVFENTCTFEFKLGDTLAQTAPNDQPANKGKIGNPDSLIPILNAADAGFHLPGFEQEPIKENDIIEVYIKRDDFTEERVYLGFVTPVQKNEVHGQPINTTVTCYGISKLLGLTRVVADPAISSQFETGSLEIDNPDFTPFENIFSNMSIQDLFTYIMRNALALRPTAISTNAVGQQIALEMNTVIDAKQRIAAARQQQLSIVLENKKVFDQAFPDAILSEIDNSAQKDIDAQNQAFTNGETLAREQYPSQADQNKLTAALNDIDERRKLAEAKSKSDAMKNLTTQPILGQLNPKDSSKFAMLFNGQPALQTQVVKNWSTIQPLLYTGDSSSPGYLDLEKQIRADLVTQLQGEKDLSSPDKRAQLRSIRINYCFDPTKFTDTASFRTMFQVLYLLTLMEGNSTISFLAGGGDLFAYNRAFKKGWERFYSQLDFAETPLGKIREEAFYDVFESEDSQIICRPPRYNEFNYYEFFNNSDFVISHEQIITNSKGRDDLNLETRSDYYWYQPFIGSAPYHGGHYTDIGILTKYGMRADTPKSNPNAVSTKLAALFAAMRLARQNAQTRTITLTVVNDRPYHLGQLYLIADANQADLAKVKQGTSTSLQTISDLKLNGYVGYLAEYGSTYEHKGVSVHNLTFTYVRKAEWIPLIQPLGVYVTDMNGVSQLVNLFYILNFKRLPDLNTILSLVQDNPDILNDEFTDVNKQLEALQQKFQNIATRPAAVLNNFYVSYSKGSTNSLSLVAAGNLTPNFFTPGFEQKPTLFQYPSSFCDPATGAQGTITQSLIDLLYILDQGLVKNFLVDFDKQITLESIPGASFIRIPKGTPLVASGVGLGSNPTPYSNQSVTTTTPLDINLGAGYPVQINPLPLIDPNSSVQHPIRLTMAQTPITVNPTVKITGFTFPSDATITGAPTTNTANFQSTITPNTFAITVTSIQLAAGTTIFLLSGPLSPFTAQPTFSIVPDTLSFSILNLILTNSILAGSMSPESISRALTGKNINPLTNLHMYGAALDFMFAGWATQNGGLLDISPTFIKNLNTLLTQVFGKQGDAIKGGWVSNSTGFTTYNGQPLSTNQALRYHVQVPPSILFPGDV